MSERTIVLRDHPEAGGKPLYSIELPEDVGDASCMFHSYEPFLFLVVRRAVPRISIKPKTKGTMAVQVLGMDSPWPPEIIGDDLEMATRLVRAWEQRVTL